MTLKRKLRDHPHDSPLSHRLHIRPARNYSLTSGARNRILYALLVLAVVTAGLLWRSRFMPLPPTASKYGGDALWALVVFVGFGFVFPRASTLLVALLALTFSWAVEFSQLYHAGWLDAVRVTLPGRLVLGSTFNWPDLAAYTFGVALGSMMEYRIRRFPNS